MTANRPVGIDRSHFQALDGLRGIAAILVVLLHVEWTNHLTRNTFVQNSYLAVDLFFILSGLVIASNYTKRIKDAKSLRAFLCLRFFRLYPIHIAVLGLFVVLEAAKLFAQHVLGVSPGGQPPFTGDSSLPALAANLLLVQGLHVIARPSWNGPSWSISCEFAAYIAFGIAVLTTAGRRKLFYIIGSIGAVVTYLVLATTGGSLNFTADWGIARCLAGFFLGMAIFEFRDAKILRNAERYAAVCTVPVILGIILTMACVTGPFIVVVIPMFVGAIVLLRTDKGPIAWILMARPTQFLGRVSYSIYMVHDFLVVCLLIVLKRAFVLPIVTVAASAEPFVAVNLWKGDILVVGMIGLVIVTAALSYRYIEEPGRLYGRRLASLSPNRSSVPDAHAPSVAPEPV